MTVWQVATGEAGRDYRELFFDHDLMILGPIVFGEAQDGRYAVGKANSPVRQVDNFARGPMPGDRVLMRFGREVIGVGEIPNGEEHQYRFDRTFRSVYGWDLCHLRRVKWAPGVELGDLATVYHRAKQKPTFPPYCCQTTNTGELRFRALLSESGVDRLELARCLP